MPQDQSIPYGFCQCGCGQKTNIVTKNDRAKGLFRGDRRRFICGHQAKTRPVIEEAKPFKIDGVYCRLIPLGRGFYAIVDASDYEWLMQWKWFAWRSKDGPYYARRGDRKLGDIQVQVQMHREVLGLQFGDKRIGDHKDCMNTLDNRKSNLRIADYSQSSVNRRTSKKGSSGYRGVHFCKKNKKWLAYISWRNHKTQLGYFRTPELAYEAYCAAAVELHGEFAKFK